MYKTNDFRKGLKNVMDESKTIPKGRLYDAFLEVTVRYLNEMISTLSLEQTIIKELGEERGNEVIEKVATSNPNINDLEHVNGEEEEIKNKIINLFDAIEKMQRKNPKDDYPIGLE